MNEMTVRRAGAVQGAAAALYGWFAAIGGVASSVLWMLLFVAVARGFRPHVPHVPAGLWTVARALGIVAVHLAARLWPLLLVAAGGAILLTALVAGRAARRGRHDRATS